jgi:hypothetical protein
MKPPMDTETLIALARQTREERDAIAHILASLIKSIRSDLRIWEQSADGWAIVPEEDTDFCLRLIREMGQDQLLEVLGE